MLILKFHCHCKGNEISVLTYCSFSQVSQCKRLNKWAILTWRNIADSAGPCHAGGAPMTEVDLRPPLSIWASQSMAMLSRRCLALWLPAGRPPPPVWISSSKSTTQSPSVAVWPARTFISRWCDGRVGSLPGHPHTPHISVPSSSPPSPTLHNREFTLVDMA